MTGRRRSTGKLFPARLSSNRSDIRFCRESHAGRGGRTGIGLRWHTVQVNAMEAVGRLSGILDTLAARGFDTRPLVVDPPASPSLVDATEDQLGCKLPTSLRNVLTTVASRADFAWFAPTGHTFPNASRDVFSGDLSWSLNDLPDLMGGSP